MTSGDSNITLDMEGFALKFFFSTKSRFCTTIPSILLFKFFSCKIMLAL